MHACQCRGVISLASHFEGLWFQAQLRLPESWSVAKKIEIVAYVIKLLGLEDVVESIIGNPEVRGISGGQRKRVNIGMELVADPTFLALDEPTSGLDSTSSLKVVGALKAVAIDQHLTVVAVIHQPR
jgi:ABC-type multidrug transport system ATPase subunit